MTTVEDRRSGAGFFSPIDCPPQISRCKKIFCVVKNHAARHKNGYCNRENIVSYREMRNIRH
ncbi:hypothetical protein GCT19_03095 [Paraburkholderia sp. CNPSo 3155]|nr:hypothetical protein [Paraburkholderia atlantica]